MHSRQKDEKQSQSIHQAKPKRGSRYLPTNLRRAGGNDIVNMESVSDFDRSCARLILLEYVNPRKHERTFAHVFPTFLALQQQTDDISRGQHVKS